MLRLSATDNDASWPNNVVSYVIEAGSRDQFVVDPLTGHVTVSQSADWLSSWRAPAGGQYHVTVAVVDAGCPTLRSVSQLNITVIDVTNPAVSRPVWNVDGQLTLVTSVPEDAELGHVIYRCVAVNPHGAQRLRYDWLNESARGFDVTGRLITGQSQYVQVRRTFTSYHIIMLFASNYEIMTCRS